MYFPSKEAKHRLRYSVVVILSMVLMIAGVVAAIYVIRFQIQQSSASPYASLIASVLNSVQITVFNMIYGQLATQLTDYENHRTDTDYEDSMIVKLFAFQFVNSYASFFFLAFIASYLPKADDTPSDFTGQCGAPTCMTPMSINLAIIFGTRITLTNFLDVFLPYMAYKSKVKKETEGTSGNLTRPEKDYMLMPYDIMAESIKDYADTAIQYGFMTLFITALPIACFFSALSNHIKVKASAWKMLTVRSICLSTPQDSYGLCVVLPTPYSSWCTRHWKLARNLHPHVRGRCGHQRWLDLLHHECVGPLLHLGTHLVRV